MPTQRSRLADQTCPAKQQRPAVSLVTICPGAHPGAHSSPSAPIPGGQRGMPTHSRRCADQTWPGQQQCPSVSSPIICPPLQEGKQRSPLAVRPAGQRGAPTQISGYFDQRWPGQQQSSGLFRSRVSQRPKGGSGHWAVAVPAPATMSSTKRAIAGRITRR
ncbi:MAG: hypothetical protein EXR72_00105 [Myxococcales bacterium]|nr:hypothetical protein [Myxococcales bacterium]